MACGFSQKEGIAYEETFVAVAKHTSIRTILDMDAVMKWKIDQMDVKTTFLNVVVEEELYVEKPLRFERHDMQTHVCKLKKVLYGLKQAPRTWYDIMNSFLISQEFTKSKLDSKIYFKVEGGRSMMLLLYVDDLFLIGEDELIKDARRILATEFKMKYLGMMHYFLGMEVW